uniref:Uncharacterized protein n=1 Tax=viral metagenome TaxID=1070528 RepID=A0A6M3JZY6_9ZZZZ
MPVLSHTRRVVFSGQNLATTGYIYNSNASPGTNDGWYNSKYDAVTVQLGCATLTSKTVVFRIEGRYNDSGRVASLYNTTISVGGSMDKVTTVSFRTNEVRIGAKLDSMVSTPLASPHNIYANIQFTDYRQ